MTPPVIIQAQLNHLDQLVPLLDQYRQFYRQPSAVDEARRFLQARLAGSESVIFLALRDNVGVGFTQLYPSFSSVSLRRLWILNDLFVAGDQRGQGVATALLERARTWAIATHAKGMALETAVDNPAQQLYERLGWQRDNGFYHYSLTV
ncbi:MAG: GNAT family N-acetyltransferase [Herpetosiphonaceae bacterium]|nr:GNAT family N-acetyltransferase [Herpetosiphonaceae bacterium]